MSQVNLPKLMMKLTCDKDPKHRHDIVRDHLRIQHVGCIEHCFWDLVAACPDQIDQFLRYADRGTPSIPRIKKLMTNYYEYFKKSAYFDKKYLEYDCVGDVDPIRRVEEFCWAPSAAGRKGIAHIYQFVDARVEGIVRKSVPAEYIAGCFDGPAEPLTSFYIAYDKKVVEYKKFLHAKKLTNWEGKILLHISMGAQRALAWSGYKECVKTFKRNTNADVRGIHRLILSFVTPVREDGMKAMSPKRPSGHYSFSIPKEDCESYYARTVALDRQRDQMRKSEKAARKAEKEEAILRRAEEIKRGRAEAAA